MEKLRAAPAWWSIRSAMPECLPGQQSRQQAPPRRPKGPGLAWNSSVLMRPDVDRVDEISPYWAKPRHQNLRRAPDPLRRRLDAAGGAPLGRHGGAAPSAGLGSSARHDSPLGNALIAALAIRLAFGA